jgi:hypothetical protein
MSVTNNDPAVLFTPQGQELLARLAEAPVGGSAKPPVGGSAKPPVGGSAAAATSFALAERLRREYPAALVAAAMAQQELRAAAAAKFSRAAEMLFTRAGYEQSSSETIAAYRAGRLGAADTLAGTGRIADLCCGIGGDLIALADKHEVLAVDRDATHARLAVHNVGVYGRADNVTAVVADVRDVTLTGIDAVFIDPARRSGQGAASAPHAGRYKAGTSEPPLDWCAALTERVSGVCVKAAPGIPEEAIPDGWEAEFIAEHRDLKEAVLWSPALAVSAQTRAAEGGAARRATVLTAGLNTVRIDTLVAHAGDPLPLREPGEYLLDPSPAITRAGLVEDLARALAAEGVGAGQIDIAKIDPRIAFLTLDSDVRTPFARTLRVSHSAPWREKDFARRLRELGIGAVDIRRRGLAGNVDEIRKHLKLVAGTKATLVITRVNDRPWGLICTDPVEKGPDEAS